MNAHVHCFCTCTYAHARAELSSENAELAEQNRVLSDMKGYTYNTDETSSTAASGAAAAGAATDAAASSSGRPPAGPRRAGGAMRVVRNAHAHVIYLSHVCVRVAVLRVVTKCTPCGSVQIECSFSNSVLSHTIPSPSSVHLYALSSQAAPSAHRCHLHQRSERMFRRKQSTCEDASRRRRSRSRPRKLRSMRRCSSPWIVSSGMYRRF